MMRFNNFIDNFMDSNNKKLGLLGYAGIAAIIILIIGFFESKALLVAGAILLVVIVGIGFVKGN